MRLRDYQQNVFDKLIASESNDLVQLDTGAGKTPIEAALAQWAPRTLVVAHRITLIQQISEKLAAFGLEHDTVSTEHTRRRCMGTHRTHGRNHIQRGHAQRLVVSIDSLHAQIKRGALAHIDRAAHWLIIIDEAHHVVPDNKWGALRTLFPDSRIVGFTATPARMDGESLHVDNGGLFDRLVQADGLGDNSARELIERGWLSDYVAYASPTVLKFSLDEALRAASSKEEYEQILTADLLGERDSEVHLRKARAHGNDYLSGIVMLAADPVNMYKGLADGTQAILMAPAIKNAEKFALSFRDAGVPAAAIHSTMPRSNIMRALDGFASGRVRVLCNVDMIGEGFDMPAVQTLIIASSTASFPRYRQWVGRVLRPAPGKDRAIIIDLTRQIEAHGMPDDAVKWDLLNPPCGPKEMKHIPCQQCGAFYKLKLRECPECGAENEWLLRGKPLGAYEFDIKVLDTGVVRQARDELTQERIAQREREHELRRQTEVIWPQFSDAPGLIGDTVEELRKWFVDGLQKAGVPCADINAFLESEQAQKSGWWIDHFTAADLRRSGATKSQKVFKKWKTEHCTTN